MTIRPADPERDAAACAAIYAPSVESKPISFELVPPDAAEFAGRIAKYAATHQFLVGEEDGEVLGYVYACSWAERPAYDWSVETSVYVGADHQGKGVGRALYTELFDRLRTQGFRVAVAGITLPNPASIGLHESMGFEPIGALRDIGWKEGGWHDVGYWQLYLRPPGEETPVAPLPPGPAA
ncbi:MAG TPA: GNAT family N-acetyltransferase [Solirubrobacterales bacterium]|jgi:phosphinothricin acetyltransferase|nr:GNAT family N-acetyltransferase [Solirubrobacterales bacterium]